MDVRIIEEFRDQEKVKEELPRGLEAANQLLILVAESRAAGVGDEDATYLNARMYDRSSLILNSFDTAISILKSSVQLIKDGYGSASLNDNTRRRSYSNRRTTQPEPVKTITTTEATTDGYTWRKYGQKPIVNTKHPREYYKCGYKDEAGCQATKQVQVIAENPYKYMINYYAHHTCQFNKGSKFHALMGCTAEEESPNNINMLCFDQNKANYKSTSASSTTSGLKLAGLNQLSMIFSSLSSNDKMVRDQEKPIAAHDYQYQVPELSPVECSLSNFDGLIVPGETSPRLYPSLMLSPQGDGVDDLVIDEYSSFLADWDEQFAAVGSQNDFLPWDDTRPGDF